MYVKVTAPLRHQCSHGHTWSARPRSVLQGRGCPTCAHHTRSKSAKGKHLSVNGVLWDGLMGFEPQAIRWLMKNLGLRARDIRAGADARIPVIEYRYNGKVSRHYPDIHIPKLNTLVEVKSTWTMFMDEETFDRLVKKRAKAERLGYTYKVLLLNHAGERLPLPKSWWNMERQKVLGSLP